MNEFQSKKVGEWGTRPPCRKVGDAVSPARVPASLHPWLRRFVCLVRRGASRRRSYNVRNDSYYFNKSVINSGICQQKVAYNSRFIQIRLRFGISPSTSFGWDKGGNVTSAGWQITLCDPIRHVCSRRVEASC